MSYSENPYQVGHGVHSGMAAFAEETARTAFIRRTYLHLAGAVGLFVAIETVIFTVVDQDALGRLVMGMFSGWNWLIMLGAFMGVSYLANYWAQSNASRGLQYAGLLLYVLAEAVIFVPLLYLANTYAPKAIPTAGVMTLITFGGLTLMILFTKADASWLGKYLCWGGIVALGVIVCAIVFQFALGVWFSALMVGLASGYILYYTSNILHHYRTDQHVAASLALFASVALLFYYILRLVMQMSSD